MPYESYADDFPTEPIDTPGTPVPIPAPEPAAKPIRFQCRHIFTNGRRCGSPCLRHEQLCYHHHAIRKPIGNATERQGRRAIFDLPANLADNDRGAIQLSLAEVLRRIALNQIDPRRAGLLLYGLQTAAAILPRELRHAPATIAEPGELVLDIIHDPALGTLAPTAELTLDTSKMTWEQTLLAEFELLQADYLLRKAEYDQRSQNPPSSRPEQSEVDRPPSLPSLGPDEGCRSVLPNLNASGCPMIAAAPSRLSWGYSLDATNPWSEPNPNPLKIMRKKPSPPPTRHKRKEQPGQSRAALRNPVCPIHRSPIVMGGNHTARTTVRTATPQRQPQPPQPSTPPPYPSSPT